MAKSRDIKRRIKSVKNTSKITRTMELIATAKSQTCQARIRQTLPYFASLAEIAREARRASGDQDFVHPLVAARPVKKVAILVVTANRGLCGGYNGNVLRLARDHRAKLMAEGVEVRVVVSGKKGINWMRFQKIPYEKQTYTQFEDRPAFSEVEKVGDHVLGLFLDGQVDRVDVVYTHYYSAGKQGPVVEGVLPLADTQYEAEGGVATRLKAMQDAFKDAPAAAGGGVWLIEPDPRSILDAIFPLQAKLNLFRVYLEAATSEQIARRVAMKNATDNALEVGRALRMAYNRARQNQITKEILEVLGGAEALA
jgi:F-type H+-transporting ATPase subunit gamma